MPEYALDHVPDVTLLADLAALVAKDRGTTAALLAHIGEVDARELFKPAACSTMHAYCTRVLHLSEDSAYKRVRAARAGRRFPQIFDAIADGRLHVSGVVVLAPHLSDANVDELIAEATHRSKAEIEMIAARIAPRPDMPTAITPLAPPLTEEPGRLAPGPIFGSEPPPAPTAGPPSRVKALAPDRFGLQLTISQATREKLERARALMRHRNPSGDLEVVLDRALDALLAKLEKEKFGATARPRVRKSRARNHESDTAAVTDASYVSNEVRRAVHERDNEQCTFVSQSGVRCTERGFLEFDHRTPKARGGQPTTNGTRLLCKAHNQYEAERILGADFMRAKREVAAATRAARVARRARRSELVPAEPAREPSPTIAPAREPLVDAQSVRLVDAQPARGVDMSDVEAAVATDVASALRGLGFKAAEVRQAMDITAEQRATTFEGRIRAALAVLPRIRASRCCDGAFESFASSTG